MFGVTCKIFQSQTTEIGSSTTKAANAGVMSQNSEESTHDVLFYGTKTKLLISSSKPQVHEGFLKSTR